jgi:hypothetical protein
VTWGWLWRSRSIATASVARSVWADGAVGPALGSEHPGGGPAARHVAGRQRLTLRERRRTHSIIDFLAVKGAIRRVARQAAFR